MLRSTVAPTRSSDARERCQRNDKSNTRTRTNETTKNKESLNQSCCSLFLQLHLFTCFVLLVLAVPTTTTNANMRERERERDESKIREDLEQELVRNHRHRRRIIDQRSNHRHRRHCLLHPSRSISMEIWMPCERVGEPLIGSNHMHSMACREGDETSMLVERNFGWLLGATIEG